MIGSPSCQLRKFLRGTFPRLGLWTVAALSSLIWGAGCQSGGTNFYPLGIYSVRDTNDLAAVQEAGFNLVMGPARKEFLDAAHAVGVRVLASPGTSAGKEFDAAAARRLVTALDGHPGLWAWYLVDEPDLHGVAPEAVQAAHRFIKQLPARKPTALVIYQGARALDYASIADITMIDRYPIPWLPLANFPQHVRMVRLALGKEKPLIAVIQAFDWSYYPDLMPGEENLRPPDYDELRCMTYLALAQRANGIFYYCYSDSNWQIQDHPETWEALKMVVREVNIMRPLFQADHLWWPYSHRFGDRSIRFNATLESSITPALLHVRKGTLTLPPGQYILLVNNTDKYHIYRIRLPRPVNEPVPVLGEARFAHVEDNWLEEVFGPYSVHIYGPLP